MTLGCILVHFWISAPREQCSLQGDCLALYDAEGPIYGLVRKQTMYLPYINESLSLLVSKHCTL